MLLLCLLHLLALIYVVLNLLHQLTLLLLTRTDDALPFLLTLSHSEDRGFLSQLNMPQQSISFRLRDLLLNALQLIRLALE